MPRPYTLHDERRLAQAPRDYQSLREALAPTFSLAAAFDHPGFNVDDYCRAFQPNPHGPEAEADARTFCEHYGIWLPGLSEHCVHMGTFLYPDAGGSSMPSWVVHAKRPFAGPAQVLDYVGRHAPFSIDRDLDEPILGLPTDRLWSAHRLGCAADLDRARPPEHRDDALAGSPLDELESRGAVAGSRVGGW